MQVSSRIERKLTTILAADAEGYSREMNADEARAFDALHDARDIFSRFITRHNGRIANTAGDGLIAEFPSVVEAVKCAIEVQSELGGGASVPGGQLHFRIGIHLGDVMVDGDDLLGEGVNLAARLQAMAEPGGILISRQVYDQVHSKLSVGFDYLGEKRPKNFPEPVSIYGVASGKKRFGHFFSARAAQISASPAFPETPAAGDLKADVVRQAKLLAALWLVILAGDLATGRHFWAHWPGLAIAAYLGWRAAPLFARPWIGAGQVRMAVILAGLTLINLFTWSGVLWALWPAGILIVLELLRQLRHRSGR